MSEEGIMLYTDYTAEKVKFDIKDGKAVIDNKEFIIDRIQPITLREKKLGRIRFKPFYILKWDKIEPVNIQAVEIDHTNEDYAELAQNPLPTIRTLEVVFPEKSKDDILPEMLKETHDMRYMKHMKKYAAEGAGGGKFKFGGFKRWMIIPIAFIISAIAMFFIQGGRFF
jgi:hypothetical protein